MVDVRAISDGLTQRDDGIWYGAGAQDISYPSDANALFAGLEDRSFWFKHRNACIVAVVERLPPPHRGPVLDVGGGNGFVAAALALAGFDTAVLEPGAAGALNAKRRGVTPVICASLETGGFRPDSMAGIGLFDVVEHIADDLAFLKSIRMLLKPGGRLYVTVPAYSLLWSSEDVAAGHFRRYSLKSISRVLSDAGFEVEFASYFFRFLPIAIALLRAIPYRLGFPASPANTKRVKREHILRSGTIFRIITVVLEPEPENLKSQRPMRFGGSCLVVAMKPE